MAKVRKRSRPNSGEVYKAYAQKHRKDLKQTPNVLTYGKIARALGVRIGFKEKSMVDQLAKTGLALSIRKQIEKDRQYMDSLRAIGYDVEPLYVQLVERIQVEITANLPF